MGRGHKCDCMEHTYPHKYFSSTRWESLNVIAWGLHTNTSTLAVQPQWEIHKCDCMGHTYEEQQLWEINTLAGQR